MIKINYKMNKEELMEISSKDISGNLWQEYPTYYLSMAPQGSQTWLDARIGIITMSSLSSCTYRSGYKTVEDDIVNTIIGLKKLNETPAENLIYMEHGVSMEPVIRDWYSEEIIKKPIKEVGLAVWKEDPRFGGSLDGEIDSEEGIEIKAPRKMYWKLVEYIESKKKGFNFYKGYHEHVFNSHYDQMTGNGIITDKKFMHYIVVCSDTQQAFTQRFPVDKDLWETILYPKASEFYNLNIEPKMKELNIKRIDPII
jgi:hypothetical protein